MKLPNLQRAMSSKQQQPQRESNTRKNGGKPLKGRLVARDPKKVHFLNRNLKQKHEGAQ